MKTFFTLFLFAAVSLTAATLPPSNQLSVMVNTNGQLIAPTNFQTNFVAGTNIYLEPVGTALKINSTATGGGGGGTNTLYQSNGVTVGTSGTFNIVPGSNTVVLMTNAGGVVSMQIHGTAVGGGGTSIDTNAFQPASIILTNLSGTGALTNASDFQPANIWLTNISGTGALTNATAFQPAHVILSNAIGTGVLTNANAFQPANATLTNLAGTGALTNQGELDAKQFGSLILTNLAGTSALTNRLAGAGGLVWHTNAGIVTVSNSVAGGGGDSFPAQTNLYAGFPLATDGSDVFWGGPFYSARIWDDFMFSTNLNARIGEYGWNVVQGGNGTFDGRPSGFGRSHVQIIRTDGGSSDITHLSQFTKSYWFGKGPVMFSVSVYVSHVPDATQQFTMLYGFGDTHLGDATNGVYFKGNHDMNNWQFVTVTNSIAQTSVCISNIVVGWNSLNYLINADGTEAVAYVGTSIANAYPVATNTGNIPRFEHQACMPIMHIRKTLNTDRRTNAVDYFYFHEKFATPR